MNFAVDTETTPTLPAWHAFKRVRFDMDGLVHRVTAVRAFHEIVHGEETFGLAPYTGCGVPLHALAKEGHSDPESAGFCDESVSLTCMTCASGRAGDGDTQKQTNKALMFSALYGKSSPNVMAAVRRQAGKSQLAKSFAEYQKLTNAYVLGYAAHDAVAALAMQRKPRFRASFIRRLARLVLR